MDKKEKIIQTLLQIPKGKVASYGQIADLAGLPGRARLVGKLLKESPNELELPWFRVLKSNGLLAFEPYSTTAIKQKKLLSDEGVEVIGNRVDLKQHGWQPSLADILFKLTN